jgi:hypothetical protein
MYIAPLPETFSEDLKYMTSCMISRDPSHRPDIWQTLRYASAHLTRIREKLSNEGKIKKKLEEIEIEEGEENRVQESQHLRQISSDVTPLATRDENSTDQFIVSASSSPTFSSIARTTVSNDDVDEQHEYYDDGEEDYYYYNNDDEEEDDDDMDDIGTDLVEIAKGMQMMMMHKAEEEEEEEEEEVAIISQKEVNEDKKKRRRLQLSQEGRELISNSLSQDDIENALAMSSTTTTNTSTTTTSKHHSKSPRNQHPAKHFSTAPSIVRKRQQQQQPPPPTLSILGSSITAKTTSKTLPLPVRRTLSNQERKSKILPSSKSTSPSTPLMNAQQLQPIEGIIIHPTTKQCTSLSLPTKHKRSSSVPELLRPVLQQHSATTPTRRADLQGSYGKEPWSRRSATPILTPLERTPSPFKTISRKHHIGSSSSNGGSIIDTTSTITSTSSTTTNHHRLGNTDPNASAPFLFIPDNKNKKSNRQITPRNDLPIPTISPATVHQKSLKRNPGGSGNRISSRIHVSGWTKSPPLFR